MDDLDQVKDDITAIREYLFELKEDITEIKIENAEQHVTLKEHTRRSLASEKRLEEVEDIAIGTQSTLNSHLAFIKGAIWVLGGIGVFLGVVWTCFQAYLAFKGVKV